MNAAQGRKTESTPTRTITTKNNLSSSPLPPHANPKNNSKNNANKDNNSHLQTLDQQRMNDEKESFVRTVISARQKCDSFNQESRQIEQYAMTQRDPLSGTQASIMMEDSTEVLNGR